MSFVLTLVACPQHGPLTDLHIRGALDILTAEDIRVTCAPVWLAPERAADIGLSAMPDKAKQIYLREYLDPTMTDFFITHVERRRKKLLVADMDSTIVAGETLNDLAEFAGVKNEVAAITREAMEGKLDFQSALRERVRLLKGLSAGAIVKTIQKMRLNPGAFTLTQTMKSHGTRCVLVSGGFTVFTEAAATLAGFDTHHGNTLLIESGIITGRVADPVQDKFSKAEYLQKYRKELKLDPKDTLAMGDGANDLPMLKAAGLGIGYRAKAVISRELDNIILHNDLSAALFAQGYSESHFVKENQ